MIKRAVLAVVGLLLLTLIGSEAAGGDKDAPLFIINQGGKAGYMDRTGKIVIPPRFDGVTGFREGLASVKVGEKWGVIDQQGKMVVPPQFDEVKSFFEGMALARFQKKYGFIDRNGKIVIQPQFRLAGYFAEGLAWVEVDDKCGYIDPSGTMVLPPKYEAARSFSEGLAPVKTNGKWGYIDKSGKLVIAPRFDSASPFRQGLAEIGIGGQLDVKFGFINRQGTLIIPLQPFGEVFFSEGLLAVPDDLGKWGFRDATGKWVIPPRFDAACCFYEGLAFVAVKEKYGFIDKTGKLVIPLRYEGVEKGFSEGLAAVEVQGKWGYIDKQGKMVIPPKFDRPWPFKGGLAEVIQGETEGYIDRNGKFIWPPGQLQEPPSPPPGELQPSPIKPPQKKEKLTYEDRQAWKKILQWPNHCSPDPADLGRPDAGLPHENPSGLRFWQLEPKKYLVEVKCWVEPYNDLQLYLFYDETTEPPTSRLLQFERYDPGAKIIVGEPDTELSGYPEFHPQKRELTLWTRPPGLGEWDTWTKYRITEDKGVFLEVRAKAPDDNGKYKGIPQDPATYPIVVRPPIKAHLGKQDTYIDSGTVQGGELTADGIDLFSISFAKHDTFERLVFDLHQWNMKGNPPAVRPSFFLVAYEQYPYRLVFEIEGIRMVNATFPNFAGSNYINNLHVAGSLGDSGVKYALTLKKPIEFEIYELHQPARIVVDIKGSKIKREKLPAVYSLRTQSLQSKSVISIQEILTGMFRESRILQSRNKKYLVEEGYYKTKQDALTRKKYLVKNLKELKEIDKGVILFIEKREVNEIPKVIHK
ncbi:MAG: WG repeat-containing protein [Proteobacteria bacterium]|nr:WG repeat-containing protein [Pseudomonadota bacterium]